MLPLFPDAALWVVIFLFVVGVMLLYFGSMAKGMNKVLALLFGVGLILYAGWNPAQRMIQQGHALQQGQPAPR